MATFTTSDGVRLNYHFYAPGQQASRRPAAGTGQAAADSTVGPAPLPSAGPDRPTLVLLSGFGGSEVSWAFQVEPFRAAGFPVLTYDQRNHGASARVAHGLSLARLAMDLHELLLHLSATAPLDSLVLVGHSMGAVVAMMYESLFTRPEAGLPRLTAVVTEDQPPSILKQADWLNGSVGLTVEELPSFMHRLPHLPLIAEPLARPVKLAIGKDSYPFDFAANQGLLLDTLVHDWRADLTREDIPHLFLAGGRSPLYPAATAQAARDLQPHPLSAVTCFPAAGHIPHLEEIDAFNRRVLDFLSLL